MSLGVPRVFRSPQRSGEGIRSQGAKRADGRAPDPLELELQIVMGCYVGAWMEPRSSA